MTTPSPDTFDTLAFPYGKKAGDNKFDLHTCPTCRREPTHPTCDQWPWPDRPIPSEGFFLFRDELSAREYYISGMCQACQDSVFNALRDDE